MLPQDPSERIQHVIEEAIELYRAGLEGGRYDPTTDERPVRDQAIHRIDAIVDQLRPMYTFSDEERWEREINVTYEQDGETRYIPVIYTLGTPGGSVTATLGVTTLTGDHETADGYSAIAESTSDRERLLRDHDVAALVVLTDNEEYADTEELEWRPAGKYRLAVIS